MSVSHCEHLGRYIWGVVQGQLLGEIEWFKDSWGSGFCELYCRAGFRNCPDT